jgi:hypothetical protein
MGRRNVLIISVHCDLSYDGNPIGNTKGKPHVPITYVFAGIIADASTWAIVERKWAQINLKYGVIRFHAAHLNARSNEYQGWSVARQKNYSGDLLRVIANQGKRIEGISCGMFADEYRAIISEEGRKKMGSPYLACFNSCISLLAKAMDILNYPPEDQIAVLIDPDDGYLDAISSFDSMRENPKFAHRSCLATCSSANMERVPAYATSRPYCIRGIPAAT